MTVFCPCGDDKRYEECCRRYHHGQWPGDAFTLMRSRYSAYALGLVDYIVVTTHPDNPLYNADIVTWKRRIMAFMNNTVFQKLEIVEFVDGEDEAYVTFVAHLLQHGRDTSFREKSFFRKVNGRWLYLNGEV